MNLTNTDILRLCRSRDPEKRALAREVIALMKASIELVELHDAPEGCTHAAKTRAEQERDAARLDWAHVFDDGGADRGSDAAAFRNLRRKYGDAVAAELMSEFASHVNTEAP